MPHAQAFKRTNKQVMERESKGQCFKSRGAIRLPLQVMPSRHATRRSHLLSVVENVRKRAIMMIIIKDDNNNVEWNAKALRTLCRVGRHRGYNYVIEERRVLWSDVSPPGRRPT